MNFNSLIYNGKKVNKSYLILLKYFLGINWINIILFKYNLLGNVYFVKWSFFVSSYDKRIDDIFYVVGFSVIFCVLLKIFFFFKIYGRLF